MGQAIHLSVRDIQRLENTSFAAAFAAGDDAFDELAAGDRDTSGCDPLRTFTGCLTAPGTGKVCIWVQSECSCGCLGCDPEALPQALQPYHGGIEEEGRWFLDIIRRG